MRSRLGPGRDLRGYLQVTWVFPQEKRLTRDEDRERIVTCWEWGVRSSELGLIAESRFRSVVAKRRKKQSRIDVKQMIWRRGRAAGGTRDREAEGSKNYKQ